MKPTSLTFNFESESLEEVLKKITSIAEEHKDYMLGSYNTIAHQSTRYNKDTLKYEEVSPFYRLTLGLKLKDAPVTEDDDDLV